MPAMSLEQLLPTTLLGFPASFAPDLAETAARIIYERQNEYDLIVVTGDLATTGHVEYLKTARLYTSGNAVSGYLTSSGDSALVTGNKRKVLLPGNHDRFRDLFGSSACPHFDLVFDSEWSPPIAKRVLEKDGTHLAVIAADFCLHQDADAEPVVLANRLGRGRVYDDVLGELQKQTQELRSKYKEVAIVWAVHFPPTASCPAVFKLLRSNLLEDAAKENSIQLFLAGHLHRNWSTERRTRRPYCVRGL
jgi:3',5'-cyclic AMP phosphodiesterase CpdA